MSPVQTDERGKKQASWKDEGRGMKDESEVAPVFVDLFILLPLSVIAFILPGEPSCQCGCVVVFPDLQRRSNRQPVAGDCQAHRLAQAAKVRVELALVRARTSSPAW